ncbi:MAG TPA: FAD-linked oxidase C-terminal domain-containing protein, partial [Stellaceae bacterium]|nr:FAD-linked oxidase C-terminal domain-containing protein [Stellaceae bacterium]
QALGDFGSAELLPGAVAAAPWRALAGVGPFAGDHGAIIWRISVAPESGPDVAATIARSLDARVIFEWGGGLLWCALAGGSSDGGAEIVRAATKAAGGHATLVRASPELRGRVPVFEPQPPALAALTRRIKESFDPQRILNPGRMYWGF